MLDVDPFSLPKTVYLFVYLDSLSIFVFALLDQYPSFKYRPVGETKNSFCRVCQRSVTHFLNFDSTLCDG
jgi:hypothetical protein